MKLLYDALEKLRRLMPGKPAYVKVRLICPHCGKPITARIKQSDLANKLIDC